MGRTRQAEPEQELTWDEAPVSSRAPDAPGASEISPQGRRGLYVPLDSTGRADLSKMRPSTIDRVRKMFSNNPFASEADTLAELEAKKQAFLLLVPPLYRCLGLAEALLASRANKLPFSEISPFFEYGEADMALLADPTARVLAKRLPEGASWADEITLALCLVAVNQQKIAALREHVTTRNKVVEMKKPETASTA